MTSSPKDEPLRLRLGTALKCRQEPYHRCLILSEPKTNEGYIVLVHVTTDDGKWPDRDCILTPAEWGELDRNSTVAYSTAMCGRVEAELLRAIRNGEFEVISSPSPNVLRKVITAGRSAEGMAPKAQAFLAPISISDTSQFRQAEGLPVCANAKQILYPRLALIAFVMLLSLHR